MGSADPAHIADKFVKSIKTQPKQSFPKYIADNAKLFKNMSIRSIKEIEELIVKRLIDIFEAKGLSQNKIVQTIVKALELKLPDAEKYARYLKRVR